MNCGPLIIGDEVTASWLDGTYETENVKKMGTPKKSNAILLNIKINLRVDINWQHTGKISRKYT